MLVTNSSKFVRVFKFRHQDIPHPRRPFIQISKSLQLAGFDAEEQQTWTLPRRPSSLLHYTSSEVSQVSLIDVFDEICIFLLLNYLQEPVLYLIPSELLSHSMLQVLWDWSELHGRSTGPY